jgi:Cytochrome oxidase c subunit VIb
MSENTISIRTAPVDKRWPTTNQTKHCFARYIEYHACKKAKGEDDPECEKFKRWYSSLCPIEWVRAQSQCIPNLNSNAFYLESRSCHVVRNYFVHRYRMYQPASWRNVIFCSLKFWIVLQTCNDRNNRNFLSWFIPIGVYTDSVAWLCVSFLLTIVCLCFSKFRVRL